MATVKDSIATMTSWLNTATEFGLALILTFVIIDVLFPGSTGLVSNMGTIVEQFSKEGLTGLIALLLFLLLFKSKQTS
ncbi:hypothetical protein JYT31_03365 [Beggiatoa alba]|nr:hypothetical protein [Beggiatoa alba]